MRTLVSIVLALLMPCASLAGTRSPANSDSQHIRYGEGFHCVLKIRCKSGDVWQSASCVLLAADTAITAAHVVVGTDAWSVSKPGGEWVEAKWVAMHPQFDESKPGSHDVAIVRLASPIEIDYYPPIYEGESEVGQVASLAGYGLTGTMTTGHSISDGIRRAGSNFVDKVENGVLVCTAGGKPTALEFCIAPGDSGGGLFLGRYLAGIHSFVSATGRLPRSRYGDETAHTRLSTTEMRSWVHATASKRHHE
jgi:hypothetical protein